jgi:hypothetical protein
MAHIADKSVAAVYKVFKNGVISKGLWLLRSHDRVTVTVRGAAWKEIVQK